MSASPRVLYVEDEEDDVFFMRNAFKRLGFDEGGFFSVEDGDRAITYLSHLAAAPDRGSHPLPTVVVLDLNLPIRSGFEVLEWLRSQPELKELPVVIFSSSGRLEDRRRAEQLGATDYQLKPASGAQFLATARQLAESWLGGHKGEAAGEVTSS